MESHELLRDDIIRLESPRYDEVLRVKQLAERTLRNNTEYSVILYHLDSISLTKYAADEIENIYRHP